MQYAVQNRPLRMKCCIVCQLFLKAFPTYYFKAKSLSEDNFQADKLISNLTRTHQNADRCVAEKQSSSDIIF